jgi:hypothetical protein
MGIHYMFTFNSIHDPVVSIALVISHLISAFICSMVQRKFRACQGSRLQCTLWGVRFKGPFVPTYGYVINIIDLFFALL